MVLLVRKQTVSIQSVSGVFTNKAPSITASTCGKAVRIPALEMSQRRPGSTWRRRRDVGRSARRTPEWAEKTLAARRRT